MRWLSAPGRFSPRQAKETNLVNKLLVINYSPAPLRINAGLPLQQLINALISPDPSRLQSHPSDFKAYPRLY